MPEFSHPVFGTVGKKPSVPEKTFEVKEPEIEPEMSLSDLQSLINCGKITDTIIIDGQRFQMSTLSDDEQEFLFKKFANVDKAGDFLELRRTVIAMSLERFNDKPIEYLYQGSEEKLDIFGMRMALIRKMQSPVIEKLYLFYEELLNRSKQKTDPEQVKN